LYCGAGSARNRLRARRFSGRTSRSNCHGGDTDRHHCEHGAKQPQPRFDRSNASRLSNAPSRAVGHVLRTRGRRPPHGRARRRGPACLSAIRRAPSTRNRRQQRPKWPPVLASTRRRRYGLMNEIPNPHHRDQAEPTAGRGLAPSGANSKGCAGIGRRARALRRLGSFPRVTYPSALGLVAFGGSRLA
jgi:hypothetical protein